MHLEEILASRPARRRHRIALAMLLAGPWFLAVVIELLALVTPLGAASGQRSSRLRGDLARMSGLPRFNAPFAPRPRAWKPNREGFQGRDSDPADWVVAGASFFIAGSTPDRVFASQLEDLAGRPVRNIAVPGRGPVHAAIWYLDPRNQRPQERVLIFGVVARMLHASQFQPILARLGPQGALRAPPSRSRRRELATAALRLHLRVQAHLKQASVLRDRAKHLAPYIPPMCIDPGWSSPVRMATYRGRPMLFYRPGITSATQSFEARGGRRVVEALRRLKVHSDHLGRRLLVVIVPDKYDVFGARLAERLVPPGEVLTPSVADVFARALETAGVEAISLFGALDAAQRSAPDQLTYHPDDTHWTDRGIGVGARATLERLRAAGD